jgi:probable rRNA maturation factor
MIVNRQRAVLVARPTLETFLRRVKKELGLGEASLTVCLVSDAEIARMNQTFRKKKGPTDVLSFPSEQKWPLAARGKQVASGPDPVGVNEWREKSKNKRRREAGKYLGDIAIAPDTARRYAKKNGRTLASELRVLILHGVLHLLGYDHETDRGEMERVERKLRKRLGLA